MHHLGRAALMSASVAVLMSAGGAAARAQDAPATSAPAPQANQPVSEGLETVIVTAQRRPEREQDVPITMHAFSGKEMVADRVLDTRDLSQQVPALSFPVSAGFAQPFMRGFGNHITGVNFDPEVATYIDGVYVSNTQGLIASLLGTESVEVLEGPQGTLYGRNATAGTISVTTLTPSAQTEGQVSATAGNYSLFQGTGYVSGQIADHLYGGIYADITHSDSYYKDIVPVASRETPVGDTEESWAVRGKLVYDYSPVRLVLSYEHTNTDGMDASVYQNVQPNSLGVALGATFVDKPWVYDGNGPAYNRVKTNLVSLNSTVDLDWAQLVNVTAYRGVRGATAGDIDGTNVSLVDVISPSLDTDTYTEEVRLQSPDESKIKWIVGAFGLYEDGWMIPESVASSVLFASAFGPGGWAANTNGDVRTSSAAAFAQVGVPITESLNLTLGGRYTYDAKIFTSSTSFSQVTGGTVGPQFGLTPYPKRKDDWGSFTPLASLDYKFDGTMVYVKYSEGFKAGAFNITSPSQPNPIAPEHIKSYEAGSKTTAWDNRLQFNTTLYYYDISNIQIEAFDPSLGGLKTIQNGPKAQAYGLELSILAQLTEELTFDSSLSWEETKYGTFTNYAGFIIGPGGNAQVPLNATGNPLPIAPKFVASLGLKYTHEFGDGSEVTGGVHYYYNDGFYWDSSKSVKQGAYSLVDLNASYTLPGGDMTFTAWMKNATNTVYNNIEIITNFGIGANNAAPRTFGLTLTKKFF